MYAACWPWLAASVTTAICPPVAASQTGVREYNIGGVLVEELLLDAPPLFHDLLANQFWQILSHLQYRDEVLEMSWIGNRYYITTWP